ncbi:uncharacterized protein LOC142167270 [Nicotiana tabacum]|uniref:Uncharacterized protein LOC142167270 n=1 Tax=Nicotiana tabacum TaxID=4097 RepID=A0AC58SF01_TOBAC
MRQQQSIIIAFDKQSDQIKREYWLRLNASVDVVRILLNQGFAFRGHDESETSLNKGSVSERFIGIVHLRDTSALSLKKVIVDVLVHHYLSLSSIRRQCYAGANNMQGDIKGLKKLIKQESRGLNQELSLVRADDTRWGSHYKSFGNFICMFGSIVDVLDTLVEDTEHDIANTMLLVQVTKKKLQTLRRYDEYDSFVDKVSIFCMKHDILVPNFDDPYVNFGRLQRKYADHAVFHHYRVEVFCKVID